MSGLIERRRFDKGKGVLFNYVDPEYGKLTFVVIGLSRLWQRVS